MHKRPTPILLSQATATTLLPGLRSHAVKHLLTINDPRAHELAEAMRRGISNGGNMMSTFEQNYDAPMAQALDNFWRVLSAFEAIVAGHTDHRAELYPWMIDCAIAVQQDLATAAAA